MDNSNSYKSVLIPNPITQVAGMPYSLYLSLQGKYFIGSTEELSFGNQLSSWVGLYNPEGSNVNLHVYSWQVTNTGQSPIRAQIWFNSTPLGRPMKVATVTSSNTTLIPKPTPRIKMLQASDVLREPEGGIKAFVRRAQAGVTIGDVEVGKFIFPPGGSFLIYLSNPETPTLPASATITYEWWEEAIH